MFLYCESALLPIVRLIYLIVRYITILVPIILIVIGTFDLLKAVTASKEDEIKNAQKMLIKRIIYAILIFLIVPILNLIFTIFKPTEIDSNSTYQEDWYSCWQAAKNYRNYEE